MARPRALDEEQAAEVQRLRRLGLDAQEIRFEMRDKGLIRNDSPSLKTIQRRVKQIPPVNDADPWSFRDADPEEARLVLPVLEYVFARTDGRVWFSRELASWISRLRTAAPAIPPWIAYVFAGAYQAAAAQQSDAQLLETRALDWLLASRVWERGPLRLITNESGFINAGGRLALDVYLECTLWSVTLKSEQERLGPADVDETDGADPVESKGEQKTEEENPDDTTSR
ncbi:MAG: hypothetical protein ACJ8F2_01225 [Xanthobacteraceae bacterium]